MTHPNIHLFFRLGISEQYLPAYTNSQIPVAAGPGPPPPVSPRLLSAGPSIIRSYVIKLRLYNQPRLALFPSLITLHVFFQLLPLGKEILYRLISLSSHGGRFLQRLYALQAPRRPPVSRPQPPSRQTCEPRGVWPERTHSLCSCRFCATRLKFTSRYCWC